MNQVLTQHAAPRTVRRSREILQRVKAALQTDSHLSRWPITCEYHEGTLILRGQLSCYYHKQIAQTVAATAEGVEQVINHITVAND